MITLKPGRIASSAIGVLLKMPQKHVNQNAPQFQRSISGGTSLGLELGGKLGPIILRGSTMTDAGAVDFRSPSQHRV
jgi:hypothetical protein